MKKYKYTILVNHGEYGLGLYDSEDDAYNNAIPLARKLFSLNEELSSDDEVIETIKDNGYYEILEIEVK